jgi:hypothetical protein
MRKAMLILVATLGVVALSFTAMAQMVDGEVTKVDESAGKITIKHGPEPPRLCRRLFRLSQAARLAGSSRLA